MPKAGIISEYFPQGILLARHFYHLLNITHSFLLTNSKNFVNYKTKRKLTSIENLFTKGYCHLLGIRQCILLTRFQNLEEI